MKTTIIRQWVSLPGTPQQVYRALMTTKGHEAFTGAPAKISGRVGGKFTAWGGYIHGVNVELVPGKRIVQKWRPSEETWPDDYYSTVRFTFAKTPRGTRVAFTHSGVVAAHAKHLASGWHESYWEPLRRYLSKGAAD
ncbi:MAG TPA: SRPBCC domain-containing protein [Thermoplasmata archaeon]|nr:SRPBCC domain-containing protein [Thermoplasmata archaeon]